MNRDEEVIFTKHPWNSPSGAPVFYPDDSREERARKLNALGMMGLYELTVDDPLEVKEQAPGKLRVGVNLPPSDSGENAPPIYSWKALLVTTSQTIQAPADDFILRLVGGGGCYGDSSSAVSTLTLTVAAPGTGTVVIGLSKAGGGSGSTGNDTTVLCKGQKGMNLVCTIGTGGTTAGTDGTDTTVVDDQGGTLLTARSPGGLAGQQGQGAKGGAGAQPKLIGSATGLWVEQFWSCGTCGNNGGDALVYDPAGTAPDPNLGTMTLGTFPLQYGCGGGQFNNGGVYVGTGLDGAALLFWLEKQET